MDRYRIRMALAAVPVALIAPHAHAQAATETFKVYFARGTSELGCGAPDLLDAIIAKLGARPWQAIALAGNVDTTLSGQAAVDASRANAESVRDYLAAHEIDKSKISITALGATNLAVSTGPNVAEPLNRRVEMTIVWN